MRFLSARRLVPACTLSVAAVAACIAPGVANAVVTQCSGSSVESQGASTQKLAQQEVWGPGFNSSTDKYACNGTQGTKGKPTVKYTSTGSGAGLESWGVNKHVADYSKANAFFGTDEPVNASQKAEIEANETTIVPKTVATIPVLQVAVSVLVDLPTGCTASSKTNKGRLVFNNSTLEEIFRGQITKWSQIKAKGDGADTITCATKEAEESTIGIVVRKDQSGTSHIFKKYLGLINKGSFETEKGTEKTWDDLSEGVESTNWPKVANVKKPAANGGGEVVKLVGETPGTIGYASLADARANKTTPFVPPTGGPNTTHFWAPIQNKEGTIKYADPASNKDVETLGNANCAKTEYTNGEGTPFPPASVRDPWNEVTTKVVEPKYTICGLTFDTALVGYSDFSGTESGEAITVENYLRYVTDAAGGQKAIKVHDYLGLTGTLLKEAQKGATEIVF